MPSVKEFSYIGVGLVYANGVPVGNVDQLDFSVEEDTRELRDYTAPGGGLANRISRISAVNGTLQMRDFLAENIARAFRGSASDVVAGSVTDEAHTAKLGQLIRTAHIQPTAMVATDDTGTTTYVDGTDYEVVNAGIIPLPGGSIPDDSGVLLSYDYGAQRVVEALTESEQDVYMVFDGVNEAQSGKPVVVDCWRLRFSPTSGVSLIGEDFGAMPLAFSLIKDPTKGAGVSQYFRVQQIEV